MELQLWKKLTETWINPKTNEITSNSINPLFWCRHFLLYLVCWGLPQPTVLTRCGDLNKMKNNVEFLVLKFCFITICLHRNNITTTTKNLEQKFFMFLTKIKIKRIVFIIIEFL